MGLSRTVSEIYGDFSRKSHGNNNNNNKHICNKRSRTRNSSHGAPLLRRQTDVECFKLPRKCLDGRCQSKLCW